MILTMTDHHCNIGSRKSIYPCLVSSDHVTQVTPFTVDRGPPGQREIHFSHQTLIPSSSKKPCRESRMQRKTQGDISIPRNVFDCEPARRVPEELHDDSRNLATPLRIQRGEGIEKSGSEEPWQTRLLPCFSVRAGGKVQTTEIVLIKSMTHHAAGIGICIRCGMTNSELSFFRDASEKFPDHTEFQSWIVNFQKEVCSKAKNPPLALQWIKEIEATKSLDDLITPKSITGKQFPDYDESDLMMATALTRCYDKQTHFRKKISVEEQRAQKVDRFLRGRQMVF